MVDERLDSWKEISKYLDRDIRTCQRWEKELGLPVYRVDEASSRSKVFSYKSEIDKWFRNQLKNQETGKKVFRKKKWVIPSFLLMTFIIISLFLYSFFLKKRSEIQPFHLPELNPIRWDLKGSYLIFYDIRDHILWNTKIGNSEFQREFYFDEESTGEINRMMKGWDRDKVDFSDIDKDGMNEVVCFLNNKDARKRCIVLFDNDGRRLWSKSIEFNQEYEGGKIVNDYRVYDLQFDDINHDGQEEILALWLHSRRFPSLFVIYDQKGTELLRYSHSGRLHFFRLISNEKDKKMIYLAGTNNLLDGNAVLAVLDCSQLKSGLAPPYKIPADLAKKADELRIYIPENPQPACQKYYLRFRHNELSRLLGTKWMYVSEIHAGKNEINVQVFLRSSPLYNLYFSFNSGFNIRYVRPGADLERKYRKLYEAGEIRIPLQRFLRQCEKDVLFWDGKGWTEKPTSAEISSR